MEDRSVTVVITADTTKWVQAMRRITLTTLGLVTRAHRILHAIAPNPRCAICHPRANPKPLCIDGHEYARRRRARGRRRA